MPAVLNTLVGYYDGAFHYERPEWVVQDALDRGYELTPLTTDESTWVMDWRTDEDPRLAAQIQTVTEQRMDRSNDVYLDDIKGFTLPKEPVTKDVLFGYDLAVLPDNKVVTCWYCDRDSCAYDYSVFSRLCPQSFSEEQRQRAFCYAMLEHFNEHRDANDLPWVTTVFPGKVITRPDGSIAATKPDVVRTWKINGGLLGPNKSWFDPTMRAESIASKEAWYALSE